MLNDSYEINMSRETAMLPLHSHSDHTIKKCDETGMDKAL